MRSLKDTLHTLINKNENVRPTTLVRSLMIKMKNNINILEQNDITEFLCLFLDKMGTEVGRDLRNDMKQNTTYPNNSFHRLQRKMDIDWIQKTGKEHSPMCDLFYGQQVNQIICKDCDKIWHNYEIFQTLSLAIEGDTLEECLEKHFEETILTEWKCDKCQRGCSSKNTLMMWRMPHILVISLKRFSFSHSFTKNNARVQIPETLDLSPYILGKTRTHYKLKSVAYHSGSYHGGHYYALCKQPKGNWYIIDDDVSMDAGPTLPDASSGYVFFYEATS